MIKNYYIFITKNNQQEWKCKIVNWYTLPTSVAAAVTSYLSLECGRELKLKTNDAVKCTECAYRILYKKRVIDPKDPIQY